MPLSTIPPPLWVPKNREYHDEKSRWSSSMLKTFRESPALAEGYYLTGKFERGAPSPSMVLGSAVNMFLLNPELVKEDMLVAESATRGAKAYKEMAAANPEKLVLTQDERDAARRIAAAIERPLTPAAEIGQRLLQQIEGYSEYAVRWDEVVYESELHGKKILPAKSMMDRVTEVNARPAIVELKTTLDPSPEGFQRQFYNLGYHAQAAFNRRGLRSVLQTGEVPLFFVVAVRNDEPFDVGVYQISEELMQMGEEETDDTIRRISRCYDTGRWWADFESLETWDGALPFLAPPTWAMKARNRTQIVE